MRSLVISVAVLAMGVMVLQARAAVDYFPVTGDGEFDTYWSEGYTNGGNDSSTRLGKSNQDIGWMAFDAKDPSGVQSTSKGVASNQTMSQFVAANGGAVQSATLYLNIGTQTLGSGTWALESIRSGNTGVLQENGNGNGQTFDDPASQILGAAEPYAFASGNAPFPVQGWLGADATPWITPSNSNVSAYGWSWTSGINSPNAPIKKVNGQGTVTLGYDANRQDVGGWAIQYLLGYANNQGGSDMARANAAGQIVNNDGAGNPVFFSAANAVAGAPRPGTATDGWYAITLSLDLANAIVNDPQLKGLAFNQYLAGTSVDWANANVGFYTKDQNSSVAPFLVLNTTPEPATMCLLALGGLLIARRRRA